MPFLMTRALETGNVFERVRVPLSTSRLHSPLSISTTVLLYLMTYTYTSLLLLCSKHVRALHNLPIPQWLYFHYKADYRPTRYQYYLLLLASRYPHPGFRFRQFYFYHSFCISASIICIMALSDFFLLFFHRALQSFFEEVFLSTVMCLLAGAVHCVHYHYHYTMFMFCLCLILINN